MAEFEILVSGYGSWREEFASRVEAEERAVQKAKWEGARNWLVWRTDLSTEFDKLTAKLAGIWSSGSGAPTSLLKARAAAKAEASPALERPTAPGMGGGL